MIAAAVTSYGVYFLRTDLSSLPKMLLGAEVILCIESFGKLTFPSCKILDPVIVKGSHFVLLRYVISNGCVSAGIRNINVPSSTLKLLE